MRFSTLRSVVPPRRVPWLRTVFGLLLFAGHTLSRAQSFNEMASESSAQQFYADVQHRISASTHDGPTYYFSQRYEMTPEIAAAIAARDRDDKIVSDLKKDPVFMRYWNGYWEYYQARKNAKLGEFCAATFVNLDGSITLTGFDKTWEGGLLMFVGKNIPQPKEFRTITATLTQNDDPPATVKIFNLPASLKMPGVGTLIFAVPSMKAALSGMENTQRFVISIENKEVFRMTWKDGKEARDALRRCLGKR